MSNVIKFPTFTTEEVLTEDNMESLCNEFFELLGQDLTPESEQRVLKLIEILGFTQKDLQEFGMRAATRAIELQKDL